MAKSNGIMISELAKELGRSNKEVLNFLQSEGVAAAKVWNSTVDSGDADRARRHFGAGSAATPAENKPASGAAQNPEQKAEPEQKRADVPQKPAGAKPEAAKTADAAKKKKKKNIIFITNPNNSRDGGSGRGFNNGSGFSQRSGNSSGFRGTNVYHPIKPLTAPSQLEAYDVDVPKYVEPVKKKPKEPEQPVVAEQTPVPQETQEPAKQPEQSAVQEVKPQKEEHPAPHREEHPRREAEQRSSGATGAPADRRNPAPRRTPGGQGTTRPGGFGGTGRPQGNRPAGGGFGGGGRGQAPSRPGQGRGGFGGGGQARSGGYPGPVQQVPGKGGSDKRRAGAEKDKRKKDKIFETDAEMTRSKRVGRFIKPEVKKEEAPEEQIKVITLPETLTIKELAEKMKLQPSAIIKKLFMAGQIVTVNSELSYEEAENIAIDYDIICEKEVQVDVIEELLKEDEDDPATLKQRPPVVCVMGHVDHGKTSLLDAIRKTSVTEKEAGGITQRIGAYQIRVNDRKITFLDTPGHEAFTAMRMRGANSTDIAVLVVAADDGVMPQTVEAINHAKAANVEIIVAVNKIDKPGANIDRVKQEMTEHGLIATDWGGQTEFVPVSAKTGEGMDVLLDTILLTADILELKANPNREARGLVLEAQLDKGRGPVANVLVQKGTLHVGDFISAGATSGKVRAMVDDKGHRLKEAFPSQPVEILGLSDVPDAGEVFLGHTSDKEAKQYANTYLQQHKKELIEEAKASKSRMSLDDLYSKIEEGKLKELNIIIKADVQGSVEALKSSLLKLSGDEVVVKIIHGGVGAITESDVSLAAASDAIIIGFDVRPDAMAKSVADQEGVEIKLYKVIYQAIDDVEYALKGMLAPVYEEKIIGHAQIRQLFKASRVGNIAGSMVTDGTITKDCKVRIRRGGDQIFEGGLSSLKRFKDDVKEVREGYECGLVFDGFDEIQVDDEVEAYIMVEVPREKLETKKSE
ncbi:MAG: translation initiation factor IF-2 [Butyrivibrio sp.]|nr:translation initiation factor IF-2 [Butyrivibrio sp.]